MKAGEVDIVLLVVAIVWGASYLAAKVLTTHAPSPINSGLLTLPGTQLPPLTPLRDE